MREDCLVIATALHHRMERLSASALQDEVLTVIDWSAIWRATIFACAFCVGSKSKLVIIVTPESVLRPVQSWTSTFPESKPSLSSTYILCRTR
jgi:hypothetical protein